MRWIFILFVFLYVSACGGGSDSKEETVTKAATEATTNTADQLVADALSKAETEKLIRFGTGKFGKSTFQ